MPDTLARMSDVWSSAERPRGRRLAFDLTVTGVFCVIALIGAGAVHRAALVVSILIAASLLIRHFWRWISVGLALIGGLVQLIVPGAFAPIADLGYAPICFLLGASRSRTTRRIGLGLALFAVVSSGIWGTFRPADLTGTTVPTIEGPDLVVGAVVAIFAAAITLGGWIAGYLQLQTRHTVQAQIDAELQAVERRRLSEAYQQEQERGRIAADMHDVVAHAWAVVAAQADGARYLLRSDPDQAERALSIIGDTARGTISDLRTILQQLRHQESDGVLPGQVQQEVLFERMRASGMHLELTQDGEPSEDALLALTAYRLLGESLTNALKHGDLTHPVQVSQDWRDGYRLTVRNRIGSPGSALGTGTGIAGMNERAVVAGGLLHARRDGADWVVEAHIPTPTAAEIEEEPS